ncbi:Yip1 family protein [Halobaculum marinum]|uniref:Yip1 family protein n=1 Tax=Halobaculum marinum TaxID=3031996 RepID=A0ABD5WVJ8_9EURY|nr:Yip1 family protein [Halobaculum sp. DT55]
MLRALTDPDGFFAERRDDPAFLAPMLVVLAAGVVGVVGSIPVLRATLSALPPEASGLASVFVVVGAVGGLVGPLVVWVVAAGVFHVLSIPFDGEGPFSRTLKIVGWGFVPSIVAGVVTAVVNYRVYSAVQFPDDPQQIQQFVESIQSRPELLVAGAVGVLLTVYQGFIWVYAVRHARRVDLRSATVVVGVPTALLVVWQLYNLL